ncbi:MAG: DUF2786 domain-containing protein [Deltaproteobacteria bacterium]|nr:DUF2786 domain-containing protein [Deltaproteobacteria bacterium]
MSLTREAINLRRAWTTQLSDDHEIIGWSYKVKLKRPIIEVYDSDTHWGDWNPTFRTMRFSVDLILGHSWDVVINILKHEMAHQIVTDIFNSVDGHGALFQRACQIIGVPDEFRRAGGDIPRKLTDFREDNIDSDNVRILEKVRKLLSLAQSNNEHEAFLAMKKANELIEKYNIERIEQNKDSQYVHAVINHRRKRIENYQRYICLILKDYFFVEIVNSYLYDAVNCETYKTIEILGTRENVLIAEYVYYFLLNQLEILWKSHKHKKGNGAKNKRSYRLGVIKGFRDKLHQMEKKRSYHNLDNSEFQTTSAMVCAQDKMLSIFVGKRFPRLTNYRSQASTLDYGAYAAGINDGKQLTIHRSITKNGGFQGKLLSGKMLD